ncbi:MAG: type 2 isopentenyl-diphosphate Delta-isomerase, partial [Lentisphaerota bacterium]
MESTNDRKLRHLRILEADRDTDRKKYYFDSIRLVHRALPEVNLKDIDPSVTFMGKTLSFPLLISSMTGGDHAVIKKINHNLAVAAEATQVAMGVGSQRVMFSNPEARASFEIRQQAPTTLLFANLGAVQLNYGFDAAMCRSAIEAVGADALYLHLNPLQEAVQPSGNTNFAGLAEKIKTVTAQMQKPVVLKEVGAGFGAEDVKLILGCGIRHIDVAGCGGTSWSRIEHYSLSESERSNLGMTFQDWGIPTPRALLDLQPYRDQLTLIASGGIRSGIDMVKAMALGASLCGLA